MKADESVAVMLIGQADPASTRRMRPAVPLRNARTLVEADWQPPGYHDFLAALRDQVIAFGKPVVYVHGDSYYFRRPPRRDARALAARDGAGYHDAITSAPCRPTTT